MVTKKEAPMDEEFWKDFIDWCDVMESWYSEAL